MEAITRADYTAHMRAYLDLERVSHARGRVQSARRADEVASKLARSARVMSAETLSAEQGGVEYAWTQAVTAALSFLLGGAS